MPPLQQNQSPPPKPNPRVLSLFLKAIIMALLTSLFFLFLGLASAALLLLHLSLSHHRHRHNRSALASSPSSSGLPSRDLNALPRFRLKHARLSNDAVLDDCVVCLDAFRDAQWCRKLSACGHVFHMRCIDSWLIKVAACPICRAPVRSIAAKNGSVMPLEDEEDKRFWAVW